MCLLKFVNLFYCIDARLVEVLMCDEVPNVEAMSPW